MRWLLVVVACAWLACAELHATAFDFDLNELPPPDDELEEPNELLLPPLRHPPPRNSGRLSARTSLLAAPAISYGQAEVVEESAVAADEQRSTKRRKLGRGGGASEQDEEKGQSTRGLFSSVWTKVRSLPAYFDFNEFARKFKRRYKTGETFLRRSVFLKNCLSIFKSRLESRLGQKSYIEDVNKFTDRTQEELKLMYMPTPPVELAGPQISRTQLERIYRERMEQIERVNDENYRPELESRCSLSDTDSSNNTTTTTTSGLLSEQQTRQLIDELYKSEVENESYKSALLEELTGHRIETKSRADLSQLGGGVELPWPGQLKSSQDTTNEQQQHQDTTYTYPQLGPSEALDWSRHECFHEIYDQGKNCGSCYVMATTALAEFYKCSEEVGQVKKRKFSKEFVLNCGQKYSPTLMGCAGGSPLETLRFIAHSGIYNIRDWREKRTSELKLLMGGKVILDKLDMQCPLQAERTPTHEWGNTRVLLNPRNIPPSRWKEALKDGPLVANVQMPSEGVDHYSSGVHDGEGCATSGSWHAMILVGYGRNEEGAAYWRFRNSFGRDWGEAGHFHLAMDVPSACLIGGVRVYREELNSA